MLLLLHLVLSGSAGCRNCSLVCLSGASAQGQALAMRDHTPVSRSNLISKFHGDACGLHLLTLSECGHATIPKEQSRARGDDMASRTDVIRAEFQDRLGQREGSATNRATQPREPDDAVQQARIAAAVRTRVQQPRFYNSLNFKVLAFAAVASGAYYYYFLQ